MSLSWNEGRFFDLWMLVHLMSGVAGGFSNVLFGLTIPMVWVVAVAMMLAWEGFEVALGVSESWENRVIDVALGLLGVALALAVTPRLDRPARLAAFAVTFVIFAAGDIRGWIAYRRRTRAERSAPADGDPPGARPLPK